MLTDYVKIFKLSGSNNKVQILHVPCDTRFSQLLEFWHATWKLFFLYSSSTFHNLSVLLSNWLSALKIHLKLLQISQASALLLSLSEHLSAVNELSK